MEKQLRLGLRLQRGIEPASSPSVFLSCTAAGGMGYSQNAFAWGRLAHLLLDDPDFSAGLVMNAKRP